MQKMQAHLLLCMETSIVPLSICRVAATILGERTHPGVNRA